MVYDIKGDREGTLILKMLGEKNLTQHTAKKDVCEGKEKIFFVHL